MDIRGLLAAWTEQRALLAAKFECIVVQLREMGALKVFLFGSVPAEKPAHTATWTLLS